MYDLKFYNNAYFWVFILLVHISEFALPDMHIFEDDPINI